ncbi:hypothetical protein PMIN05_001766 [Paraphaeosphaeria minitans]
MDVQSREGRGAGYSKSAGRGTGRHRDGNDGSRARTDDIQRRVKANFRIRPAPTPRTVHDSLALTSLFLAAKIKVALHNQHAYISHANAHIICSSLDDWKRNARTS